MPRATQTEEYWRDDYELTEQDETTLQEYFLQQGVPLTLDELVPLLMAWRVKGARDREAANGRYSPDSSYEVGQKIIFPALDDEVGEIVGIRAGENARYGPFKVLQVRFKKGGGPREFAADLRGVNLGSRGAATEPALSLEELVERYGPYVQETAEWGLTHSSNFVHMGKKWLPTVMLVTFHEGHCNIAEAMIDVMGTPMTPDELLTEIPLEDEASQEVKRFSLNYALAGDERFKNVGTPEQPLWYLPRLS